MKKSTKAMALVLGAVMLVSGSVMGTMAWLTAKADPVKNTFVSGADSAKISITLDEAHVNPYGAKVDETRVQGNQYKLVPSHSYMKDPTVTVKAKSESAFVYVEVVNTLGDLELANNGTYLFNGEQMTYTDIEAQMAKNGWVKLPDVENVYYYNAVTTLNSSKDQALRVFDYFVVNPAANAEALSAQRDPITVKAYAVQSEGFFSNSKSFGECAKLAWNTVNTADSNFTK